MKNFEKIYFLKLKMSLELYSLIPGQQVKRDRDLSNVTIQCDPLAVYPDNRTAAGVATAGNRFKPGEAGKLAVEDEICDLTINGNLEVKGKLKVSAFPAEICNIFCPEDFNLRANSSILQDAGDTFVVTAGNIISIGSAAGNTQGIHMNFGNTSTDSLKMTQANAFAISIGGLTQQATANGVNGKITLLASTTIAAGTNIGVVMLNTKIGTDSVVLYTLNVDGSTGPAEPLVAQGIGNPVAGSHQLSIRNVGVGPYASAPTQRIVINYLVINPV